MTETSLRVRISKWVRQHAEGPHGERFLFFIAFIESSVFIVPPDIVLATLLLYRKERWVYYAGLTTLASAVGGLVGYAIGYGLFETIGRALVDFYSLHEEILTIGDAFRSHAFGSIFFAAFTPIPYKAFTISAGLFSINLFVFLTASIVGRGLRFFGVAYISSHYGSAVLALIERRFKIITITTLILVVLALLLT